MVATCNTQVSLAWCHWSSKDIFRPAKIEIWLVAAKHATNIVQEAHAKIIVDPSKHHVVEVVLICVLILAGIGILAFWLTIIKSDVNWQELLFVTWFFFIIILLLFFIFVFLLLVISILLLSLDDFSYLNQVDLGFDNWDRSSVNRLEILDEVPFCKCLLKIMQVLNESVSVTDL